MDRCGASSDGVDGVKTDARLWSRARSGSEAGCEVCRERTSEVDIWRL